MFTSASTCASTPSGVVSEPPPEFEPEPDESPPPWDPPPEPVVAGARVGLADAFFFAAAFASAARAASLRAASEAERSGCGESVAPGSGDRDGLALAAGVSAGRGTAPPCGPVAVVTSGAPAATPSAAPSPGRP
ncbi:hypothetical protein ACFQ60_38400 [Streptomyces zhihengii]